MGWDGNMATETGGHRGLACFSILYVGAVIRISTIRDSVGSELLL